MPSTGTCISTRGGVIIGITQKVRIMRPGGTFVAHVAHKNRHCRKHKHNKNQKFKQ